MQIIDPDHDLLVTSESGEISPRRREDEEVSLLDLLIVLGQRKRFIFTTTLAVAILAVIACLVIPNRYTATLTILPPQQSSSLGAALLSQMGNLGPLGSVAGSLGLGGLGGRNPADMSIALLKSRSVEDAMVERFHLMEIYKQKRMSDARGAFEDHCYIETNLKDGLIRISITDHDPQRAAAMSNGYVEEYKKFSANLAVTEASQRRAFFKQQLDQAKDSLAVAEEAMKSAEQKSGMIQLDSQAKALIETVTTLRAQIAAKEVQIRGMSMFAAAENPDLSIAKEQLIELQRQLKVLGGSQAGTDSDLIVPRGKLPEAGMDYLRKLRDVKYNELIFELLAKQFELAKLDEAREGSLIQVVDPAVSPDRKSFPRASIIVPAATIVWLMIAVFWVLLRQGISRAQTRPGDRERLQEVKAIWQRNPFKA
jgi:tyrosine-protein kinase Etk/Wzc